MTRPTTTASADPYPRVRAADSAEEEEERERYDEGAADGRERDDDDDDDGRDDDGRDDDDDDDDGGGGGGGGGGGDDSFDDPEAGGQPPSPSPLRSSRPGLTRSAGAAGATRHLPASSRHRVDWSEYSPSGAAGPVAWVRWFVSGAAADDGGDDGDEERRRTEGEIASKFRPLARMLRLLREYDDRFGHPTSGDYSDRQSVLREVTQRLYSAGAPIWVLGDVMSRTGEGLMGRRGIDYLLFPRRAFINFPPPSGGDGVGSTVMIKIDRGFNMYAMDQVEAVAVRLASFASNTRSVSSVRSRLPSEETLRRLAWEEAEGPRSGTLRAESRGMTREELAAEILDQASDGAGLFFFTNAVEEARRRASEDAKKEDDDAAKPTDFPEYSDFWKIDDDLTELFSRLATAEAQRSLLTADEKNRRVLYNRYAIVLFRVASSAGASAIWYHGSWVDMLVAGVLAVVVAWVGTLAGLTRQERVISEVVASLVVGLAAGLINLRWPDRTCFASMALGAILDIMQGFRAVYAVIELMSRHTVAGGANFLEAILFTSLIAYFLKFGQKLAAVIMYGDADEATFTQCAGGISEWWYFLFVPLAAVSWSGLFSPYYDDLFLMGLHGCIAFAVYWAIERSSSSDELSNFVAALVVTASAGIVSRFTGRQALGNSVAGLYVLLPGAYLVRTMMTGETAGFMEKIIMNATVIGIGAWTGTLLCSPTLLGTTRGLLNKSAGHGRRGSHSHHHHVHTGAGAMLYF